MSLDPNEAAENEFAYRPRSSKLPSPAVQRKILLIVAAVGVTALVAWRVVQASITPADIDVHLHGPGVDRLEIGAPVALGTLRIGSVIKREIRDGRDTAAVRFHRRDIGKVPRDCAYAVESLNYWMPGNVGVRVYLPEPPGGGEPLRGGETFRTVDRVLLRDVPAGFYLLVLAAVVIVVVALVLAGVFRDAVRSGLTILIAVVIIVGGYLYLRGYISPQQLGMP